MSKRRGRAAFWPDNMIEWLDGRVPEYLTSGSSKKLLAWYAEFQTAFEDYFEAALKDTSPAPASVDPFMSAAQPDPARGAAQPSSSTAASMVPAPGLTSTMLYDRFTQYFYNKKNQAKRRSQATEKPPHPRSGHPLPSTPAPAPLPTRSASILPFLTKSKSVTSQGLYKESVRDAVSAEVSARRLVKEIDNKAHPGMLSTALKERWASLSDAERAHWEDQAQAQNSGPLAAVYANQDEFREKGHDALLDLLGTGTNQLGNGVLLMFYGLRGKNEKLHSGLLNMNPYGEHAKFMDTYEESSALVSAWKAFCRQTIPFNHPVEHPAPTPSTPFVFDDEGCPAWPESWAECNGPELKRMLLDFILSQWRFAFSPHPAPTIPWNDVSFAPLAPLGSVVLKDPTRPETKASYCSSLAEAFDACRCSDPHFRLFPSLDGHNNHHIVLHEDEGAADSCQDDGEMTNPAALQYYELPPVGIGSGAANQASSTDEEHEPLLETPACLLLATSADARSAAAVTPELSPRDAPEPDSPSPLSVPSLASPERPRPRSTGSVKPSQINTSPLSPPSPPPASRPSLTTLPLPMECTSPLVRDSTPSSAFPLANPGASFGPTGRRDYSRRKKASAASQSSPSKVGDRMRKELARQATGLEATLTAKRIADEPPEKDPSRGKRQRLAESAVRRSSTRLQTRLGVTTSLPPPPLQPGTADTVRRKSSRGRTSERQRGRREEAGVNNTTTETIVTSRGKVVPKATKFWEYAPVVE